MEFFYVDSLQSHQNCNASSKSHSMCSYLLAVPPKLSPFAITDEPLALGDYFQLMCTVLHGDTPLNITWYFNDEPITYIEGITKLMISKRSSSLNIDSVSGQHSGNYTCIGANAAGRAIISTTLSIRGLCTLFLSLIHKFPSKRAETSSIPLINICFVWFFFICE